MPTKKTAKKTVKKTAKKAVKKSAKKSTKKVTKKATAKSKKAATNNERILVCANAEECFWTTDGAVYRDLRELGEAFQEMADEVFSHHVTKDKNDFATWVEEVLCDGACAADLRKAKKPATAHKTVIRHLRYYST